MLKKSHIDATTIPDAWFKVIEACFKDGRKNLITEGSYPGQYRYELDWVEIHIKYPSSEPIIPDMPPGMEYLNPIPEGMEYIERYLPYIMTDQDNGEQYTYGQRLFGKIIKEIRNDDPSVLIDCVMKYELNSQVEEIIKKYKRGYGNNQCAMTIAIPSDVHLSDPPCLRHIDTRIFNTEPHQLHFFVYFRSWDGYNGFPANMAVITLLQQYMSECIGVETGEIIATSKGLHVYDHCYPLVKERIGEK